jgi:HK97 family phage major capsid protein
MSYLDTIKSKLDEQLTTAEEFLSREGFDPSDPAYVALTADIEVQQRSYERAVEVNKVRASANALAGIISHAVAAGNERATVEQDTASLGELFTRSQQFAEYPGRGTSQRVEVNTRALPHTLGSMGAALPDSPKMVLPSVYGPAPLLDLIPTVSVSQNSLEIITWAKKAGGPAVVAEGAAKPSVEYEPTPATVTLDTIAVYTQLTRQLMEDAPAVRGMIDTEMVADVARKLEAESAAALAAAALPAVTGEDLLKAIRAGIGTVQAAGFIPNAVLLNPADWADLDIAVFGSTLLGPSVGSQFWGLRPVASVAQPAGTATVGDFMAGTMRLSRSGISLYLTDSHADTFTKNIFTLLAETRSKTVIKRPAAFAECSKDVVTP